MTKQQDLQGCLDQWRRPNVEIRTAKKYVWFGIFRLKELRGGEVDGNRGAGNRRSRDARVRDKAKITMPLAIR